MNKRALNPLVVRMVRERPGSSVDDLLPDLPEFTRKQVMAALQNVTFYGRLRCERQGLKGQREGARPGRYYVVERDCDKPRFTKAVNSVWQLGSRA